MIGTLKSAMPWFLCCSLLARPWARHLRAIDSSRFSCVSGFWWISKLSSGWAARARGSGRLCTALGYCSVRASGVQAGKQTTLEVKVKVTRWPVPVRCSTEPCRHSFSCCLIQHFLQLSFFFIRFSSRVMFVWFSDTCWMSHPQGWLSSQAHLAGEKGGSPVGTHSVHAWTSSPGSVQHWEPPPFCSLAPGLTCLSHSGVS